MAVHKIVVLDENDKIPEAEMPDVVQTAIAQAHDGNAQNTTIAGKTTLTEVKADTDIADAISKKHSNTNDLTAEQKSGLTGSGQTSLHSHAGGSGDMTKAVYDPDADGDIAEAQLQLNYPTHSNANDHAYNTDTDLDATFEASLKNTDNHTSGSTNKVYTATEQTKLTGIQAGAQVNNISDVNATDLTDGGQTALHSHAGGGGQAFPVGSVFLAVVATNPATLLGYGTWSQIAQGQFLVGQKATDADFDVAEETGGEKTHLLSLSELASHSHVLGELRSATTGAEASYIARTADTSSTRGTDKTTELAGGGQAHNNLPPYFVVFIWRRDS